MQDAKSSYILGRGARLFVADEFGEFSGVALEGESVFVGFDPACGNDLYAECVYHPAFRHEFRGKPDLSQFGNRKQRRARGSRARRAK